MITPARGRKVNSQSVLKGSSFAVNVSVGGPKSAAGKRARERECAVRTTAQAEVADVRLKSD